GPGLLGADQQAGVGHGLQQELKPPARLMPPVVARGSRAGGGPVGLLPECLTGRPRPPPGTVTRCPPRRPRPPPRTVPGPAGPPQEPSGVRSAAPPCSSPARSPDAAAAGWRGSSPAPAPKGTPSGSAGISASRNVARAGPVWPVPTSSQGASAWANADSSAGS